MLKFKVDVLEELKRKGYTTTEIKNRKLIPDGTMQRIKRGDNITIDTLNRLCIMLRCQPGDILECIPSDDEKIKYF